MNTIIPDSVKTIGEWAFLDCKGLTSITIPDSVTTIEYYAFPESSTIYGVPGSYAETYANKYGYTFKEIQAVTPTPSAVTNVKAVPAGKNKVKLTWTKSAGADGYLIYGIVNGQKYGYVGMTSGTSFTDKKASKTQYNFYWVIPYHKTSGGKMVTGQITSKYTYGKAK